MNKQQLIDQTIREFDERILRGISTLTDREILDFIAHQIESAYDKGREDALTKTQSLLFTENGFLKEEIDISDLLNEIEKLRQNTE